MLVCFWSPKGGSGTSVIAAAAALVLARETDARIVDLAGDQPAVLGLAHDPDPGLRDWLRAGPEAPTDALEHLAVDVAPRLDAAPARRARTASAALPKPAPRSRSRSMPIRGPVSAISAGSTIPRARRVRRGRRTSNVIVVRGCYLALRRAVRHPRDHRARSVRSSIDEHGRSLGAPDVEDVLGLPVLATIPARARRPRGRSTPACCRRRLPDSLGRPAASRAAAAGCFGDEQAA